MLHSLDPPDARCTMDIDREQALRNPEPPT
jgi:hypothetical protein